MPPVPASELDDELDGEALDDHELGNQAFEPSWRDELDNAAAELAGPGADDHERIDDGHDAELEAELEVELACRYPPRRDRAVAVCAGPPAHRHVHPTAPVWRSPTSASGGVYPSRWC
jgi:hypothetical protein